MQQYRGQIQAGEIDVGHGSSIDPTCSIRADRVQIGRDVRVGAGVDISCDTLVIGDGARIGADARVTCPEIRLGPGFRSGSGWRVSLNERLDVGEGGGVGARVRFAGQSVDAGRLLWLKDDVIVGGGGSRGPDSRLLAGDGVSIFDRSYVNLSERVAIGDGTALSYDVVILTHGAWQPALMGFPTRFAPVAVGAESVIYVRAVVLPGVTIGDFATVAASALVRDDVPDRALAAGSPARVIRAGDYPPTLSPGEKDALLRAILSDYAPTLAPKGYRAEDRVEADDSLLVTGPDGAETSIRYRALEGPQREDPADITLAHGNAASTGGGPVHLDLAGGAVEGDSTPLAEDLRDFLRRRAIKLNRGGPFSSLPLSGLSRLEERRRVAS